MSILVTGAAGFLGSTVADALLERGETVIGLDNFDPYYDPAIKERNIAACLEHPRFRLHRADIRDRSGLERILARERPDAIVHLAATVSNRGSLACDSRLYEEVNIGGTAALLAACRVSPPRSFVFASTANVYDTRIAGTAREELTPDFPRTPYAWSKQEGERLIRDEVNRSGLPATILRLFTVYGPRQRPDMVHWRFCEALDRGDPVPLIGDGGEERDFIYSGDAVRAILAALNRPRPGDTINVGSGSAVSIQSLMEDLARLLDRPLHVKSRPMHANDTRTLLADIGKAERLLDWNPLVPQAEGLRLFVQWWRRIRTETNISKKRGNPHA